MKKLDDYFDDQYGVFAKLTRLKDKGKFQLPLADLKTVESDSKNHQLLDDYTVWAVNY